jgi:hypothetical protein
VKPKRGYGGPLLERPNADKAIGSLLGQFADAVAPSDEEALRLEEDWYTWLRELFPKELSNNKGQFAPFARHHEVHWQWVWNLKSGERTKTLINLWPRGGSKSQYAELAVAAVAARKTRHYGLYVCSTQARANDHVTNVERLFGSERFAQLYKAVATRQVNHITGMYGSWRHNRLETASGFILDAIGLDAAVRGVKIEGYRPDFIIIDDVDSEKDGPGHVQRKIDTLTSAVLGTVSADAAVLFSQNLIHVNSIAARLVDGRADFLAERILNGPYPALYDMEVEQRLNEDGRRVWIITNGVPSWQGQGIAECQALINQYGYSTFLREAQHEVDRPIGGMFEDVLETVRHCNRNEVPDLVRKVVTVDPAVTDTDKSDSMGIQADGYCMFDKRIYRLWSWERRASPIVAIKLAVAKAVEIGAQHVIIETNQGGDTWEVVYAQAIREVKQDIEADLSSTNWDGTYGGLIVKLREMRNYGLLLRFPPMLQEKANVLGKFGRAQQMLAAYEQDQFVHVHGTHQTLENAMLRFGVVKPFDLVDACYYGWRYLVTNAPRMAYAAIAGGEPTIAQMYVPDGYRGGTLLRNPS